VKGYKSAGIYLNPAVADTLPVTQPEADSNLLHIS